MPKVATQHINKVKSALQRNGYANQQNLAEDLEISRDTVSRFFNGKSVSYTNFQEICRKLNLDTEEIIAFDTEDENNLNSSQVLCNLPRRDYPDLIDRDEKLTELLKYISPNYRQHITVVEGIGGVGKTALVLEAAYLCCEAKGGKPLSTGQKPRTDVPLFDAIIFASAKDSYLLPFGILKRPIREATLRDVFRVIADTLDDPVILQTRNTKQISQVYARLKQQSTLLIIDNMETIRGIDREEILSFLSDLPEPTQAVITTRERIVFHSSIKLESLSEKGSIDLIKQQAELKKVKLDEQQRKKIYYRFGGIPLALIYAVGQKANGYSIRKITEPETFLSREEVTEDIARFCFERSVQPLRGKAAHKLLIALSIFADAPIRDAVAEVAGLTIDPIAVEGGLAILEQLSLVRQQEGRYQILPLTREYASAELDREQSFKAQAYDRWVKWYLDFTNKYGGKDWEGWRINYDNYINPEWRNLEQVLSWCAVHNRYEDVKGLWENIDTYIDIEGYWQTRRNWWSWLLQNAEQRGDLETCIKASSEKAWTLILMPGDSKDEAEELLTKAWDLKAPVSYETKISLATHIAVLHMVRNKYQQSLEYLERAKLFLGKANLEERERLRYQMIVCFHEGEVNYRQNNLQKAKYLFEEVINKGNTIGWQRFTNYARNGLLEILIENGDFERAEEILSSGLFIANQSKEKRRIGHYQASYARLEKKRGNREEAKNWANKALKCFLKEGIKYDADEIRSLLQELDTDEMQDVEDHAH